MVIRIGYIVLFFIFTSSCTKKEVINSGQHAMIQVDNLAGTWEVEHFYWSNDDYPIPGLKTYTTYPIGQRITFTKDGSYSCTDSIAQLLRIASMGKLLIDTVDHFGYSIYCKGDTSAYSMIIGTMPTDGPLTGMLALSNDYTLVSDVMRSVVIWFKRHN